MPDWLVGNSLMASLLALLAWSVNRFANRPAIAHGIWVLVLLRLLMPPSSSLVIPIDGFGWFGSRPPAIHAAVLRSPHHGIAVPSKPTNLDANESAWNLMATVGLCIWSVGSFGMLIWVVRASRRVTRLIERRGRFDIAGTRLLENLVDDNARRRPSVWLIDAIVSPMLVTPLLGRWRLRSDAEVKIVVPKSLWMRLDDDARAVLLMHEWTHLCRRDWIVRLVEVVTMIAFWWHPLVWFAKSQIEDCEESCCDMAAARSRGNSRRIYAETLLKTLDFLCEPFERSLCEVQSRPVASGVGSLPKIERRLRQIIQSDLPNHVGIAGWMFVAAMTVTLLVTPSIDASRPSLSAESTVNANAAPPRSGEVLSVLSSVDPDDSPRRTSTIGD